MQGYDLEAELPKPLFLNEKADPSVNLMGN